MTVPKMSRTNERERKSWSKRSSVCEKEKEGENKKKERARKKQVKKEIRKSGIPREGSHCLPNRP